jgi:hypothetical protein
MNKPLWLIFTIMMGIAPTSSAQEKGMGTRIKKTNIRQHIKGIKIGPATLDIGGGLRLRYEHLKGYNKKSYGMDKMGENVYDRDKEDGFLLERLQLNFNLYFKNYLEIFFEFQDAHAWDYDLPDEAFKSNPNEDPVELNRAFVLVKKIANSLLTFKGGRQKISYGDLRILGPGDWSNTGKWLWDAVKLIYKGNSIKIDLFYGENILHNPHTFFDHHHDKEMLGIYSTLAVIPGMALEPFYILKMDNDGGTKGEMGGLDDLLSHSPGLRIKHKISNSLYCDATYVRQFGDWGPNNINAWGMHAGLGYTIRIPWSPTLGMDYVYASGDSNPQDGEHETFDSLFGSRHKYYGYMDLFLWENLENWQFSIKAHPHQNLEVLAGYHFSHLAEAKDAWYGPDPKYRRDKTGSSAKELGEEIDLLLRYSPVKNVTVDSGCSHFFPANFLNKTG